MQSLPFPRYSIGLLQSETEMVQAPEHDLLPFLEEDGKQNARDVGNWDVELFTEATVEALVKSANRFDCIVVGHNAAHKRDDVRAALARLTPNVGLLVLHQMDPAAFSFLTWAPVGAEKLEPAQRGAQLLPEATLRDEILLNWPDPIDQGLVDPSLAYTALTPTGQSSWGTVLEMTYKERRVPVLLRRTSESGVASAISSVLLAPRHESHKALLRNLLMWCSAGRPEAVIIDAPPVEGTDTPERPKAAIIHRKLRLQGVKAVVEPVPTVEKLNFGRWPLWGTRDALLPDGWDPTQEELWPLEDPTNAMPWLRRGHRIIVLGPGESLTVRHGESDAHWVASRWASWFQGVSTEMWHGRGGKEEPRGSIVATRAVLRVLAALHGTARESTVPGLATAQKVLTDLKDAGREVDPNALGVPAPAEFTQPVSRLLRERIGDADNIDETVSTTVAALDIDSLLERKAIPAQRERLEGWLLKEFDKAALEDRLEIARCLKDPALLDRVVAGAAADSRIGQPVSAVLVTALRSAIVACGRPVESSLGGFSLDPDHAVVDRELRMRPTLAAGYLLGVLDLQEFWDEPPEDEPEQSLPEPQKSLRDPPPDRLDRAVITLGRHGPLSRGRTGAAGSLPELASTEALALIAYFARTPVPTHVVSGHETVTPGTLTSLLKEAEAGRKENERLRLRDRDRDQTARRAGTLLAVAGVALIVPAVLWLVQVLPDAGGLLEAPGAVVLFAVLVLGLLRLLTAHDLPVPAADQIRFALGQGWRGVQSTLAKPDSGKQEGQSDTRG